MAQRKAKTRARNARREAERAAEKLAAQREKLFLLEPGGTPQRPIDIETPVLVELRAASFNCPRCGCPVQLREHAAPSVSGVLLREARVQCPRCGSKRSLWFRISGSKVN
jgi:endogenous inhibitor of DNA gyrase (YacG/DUF329 family)